MPCCRVIFVSVSVILVLRAQGTRYRPCHEPRWFVETDTLCKKDTISVSKNDFNALEIVTNEIHENDKDTNGNVITIGITGSLDAPPPSSWSSRGGVWRALVGPVVR